MVRNPTKSRRKKPVRTNAAGRALLEGVRQMYNVVMTGDYSGTVIRKVEIPEPAVYTPSRIRALRNKLNASQSMFAAMLGVSVKLVQAWERGSMVPRPIARRLLDQIAADPDAFRASVIRHRTVA